METARAKSRGAREVGQALSTTVPPHMPGEPGAWVMTVSTTKVASNVSNVLCRSMEASLEIPYRWKFRSNLVSKSSEGALA
jgi:hypothetical protein